MRAGAAKPGSVLLLCVSLLYTGETSARDNPHEGTDRSPCTQCHQHQPASPPAQNSAHHLNWAKFRVSGIDMCTACHADTAAMHPLATIQDFEVPPDLPLTADKGMSCLTCHYTHGSLASDRPWASVSFMDRITDNERMHKSYLLRRNNAEGALCLICHDTSGSSP